MTPLAHSRLQEAANGLLQSVILGRSLGDALQVLATAAGAMGAGFVSVDGDALVGIPSPSLEQCVSDFASSDHSMLLGDRLLAPARTSWFTSDLEEAEKLRRHPFYQDFMRPHGMAWRAGMGLPHDDRSLLHFVVYRTDADGPFLPEDTRALDRIAPHIEAAATICRSSFDRRMADQSALFARHDVAAFTLGSNGRVLAANAATERHVPDLLGLAHGHLTLPLAGEQTKLNSAIFAALAGNGAPILLRIAGTEACRSPLLMVLPVTGEARDVFAAAKAFLVVLDTARPLSISPRPSLDALGASLALTAREKSVVGIVATGQDLSTAADKLDIGLGTARNHLKSAMQKAGVHSQVALVALLANLSRLIAA